MKPQEPSADPAERYRDEEVLLPADTDAKQEFLRGVVDGGASRGWKLLSVVKQPGDEGLLVTWDTWGPSPA